MADPDKKLHAANEMTGAGRLVRLVWMKLDEVMGIPGWRWGCVSVLLAVVALVAVSSCRSAGDKTKPDRSGQSSSQSVSLHPQNPHYFLFRNKPIVLIGSTEHYGAVLNPDFDYGKYLDQLKADGLNLTRVFTGVYCESPGEVNIAGNTLAPARGKLLCPFARSDTPGFAGGGNKFDLTRWDDAYFRRLKDFVARAGRHGVVVELTLFCPFYGDSQWDISPMKAGNNTGGIGNVPRNQVYTLKHKDLQAVQEAMVRKIVQELKDADNVYYEICNEPYFGGVTLEWQHRIADVIADAEKGFPAKHMIAQNIANEKAKIKKPHPAVSLFNFHYATPPDTVGMNYSLNKALGDDETGFKGQEDATYRREGWEFLLAGGALYDHLDFSFTVDHPEGTFKYPPRQPGGGSPALRAQLRILKEFMESLDFVQMKPDGSSVKSVQPAAVAYRLLAEPGKAYAMYLRGGAQASVRLDLPAGQYRAEWVNTLTGKTDKAQPLAHAGGEVTLSSPRYDQDVAVRIIRTDQLASVPTEAQSWPQWRGPTRSGVTSAPSGWDGNKWNLQKRWQIAVGAGLGGSPIIANEKVYVMGWGGQGDLVWCLGANDGTTIWKQEYKARRDGRFQRGESPEGPTCTPTFDQATGYLYTRGNDGDLYCWDTDHNRAKEVWHIDLYETYKVPARRSSAKQDALRDYGYTGNVLIYKDWAIMEVGSTQQGNTMAFDKRTGRQVWASQDKNSAGHSCGPVMMEVEGKPCIVSFTLEGLRVMRADAGHGGQNVAFLPWAMPFNANIPTPCVHGDTVLVTGTNQYSSGKKTTFLKIGLDGILKQWEGQRQSFVCSPVAYGGCVYGVSRKLYCLDFATGAVKWEGGRLGGETGSVLVTGDEKIIAWGNGRLLLVESAKNSPDKYRELAAMEKPITKSKGDCYSHVALGEGYLLIKDGSGQLACYAVGATSSQPTSSPAG